MICFVDTDENEIEDDPSTEDANSKTSLKTEGVEEEAPEKKRLR